MLKRIKKLNPKKWKNENRNSVIGSQYSTSVDEPHLDDKENLPGESDMKSKSRKSVTIAVDDNNNSIDNSNNTSAKSRLRKRFYKKSEKCKCKELSGKSMSKSTGDLSGLSTPKNPMLRDRSDLVRRAKGNNSSSSSRSSVSSIEALRENRLSVISKLDEYIKHMKRSVDDDTIAVAPSRLCTAQLLRMVYQRREQQHVYNSLHPKHSAPNSPNHRSNRQQILPVSQSSSNLILQSRPRAQSAGTGSLQNLENMDSPSISVTDIPQKLRSGSTGAWSLGADSSECSSVDGDAIVRVGESASSSYVVYSDDFSNNNFKNTSFNYDDTDSVAASDDYHSDSARLRHRNCCTPEKSKPLFPQNFDIY